MLCAMHERPNILNFRESLNESLTCFAACACEKNHILTIIDYTEKETLMAENILARLFEHNNWSNDQIVQACSSLTDEQLDAPPQSATEGSIRSTLLHIASAQYGYLRILTLPLEQRQERAEVEFFDIQNSMKQTGEELLQLVKDGTYPKEHLTTRDGYHVEPWVILVQIINHATEHREQIKSMLTALGITPPDIDSWSYGEVTNALVPIVS
jgi:uncharacterized damage-inducible protein DinB